MPGLALISAKIAQIFIEFDKNLPNFSDSNVSLGGVPDPFPAAFAPHAYGLIVYSKGFSPLWVVNVSSYML